LPVFLFLSANFSGVFFMLALGIFQTPRKEKSFRQQQMKRQFDKTRNLLCYRWPVSSPAAS
jgi:hypothetical protein